MVDLHTANALAIVAAETGAGIAMVGDHLQAMPVGHSGAMASMTRRSDRGRRADRGAPLPRPRLRGAHLADAGTGIEGCRRRRRDGARRARTDPPGRRSGAGPGRDGRGVLPLGDRTTAGSRWSPARTRKPTRSTKRSSSAASTTASSSQTRIAVGQGEQRLLEGDIVQTRRNDRHGGCREPGALDQSATSRPERARAGQPHRQRRDPRP